MKAKTLELFLWRHFHTLTKTDKDLPGSLLWEVCQQGRSSVFKFRAFGFSTGNDTCQVEIKCFSFQEGSFMKMFERIETYTLDQIKECMNEPAIKLVRYMAQVKNKVDPVVQSTSSISWTKTKDKYTKDHGEYSIDLSTLVVHKNHKLVQQFSCLERVCDLL